jgi:pimeloyl-ACP methyl ester carboxylesterase
MNTLYPTVDTVRAGFPCLEAVPLEPTAAPALLLHGAFADYESLRGWTARLAELGHPAVAPLRRGRLGLGPGSAAGLTFADYVDDTIAVLDTLETPPVLVGHSLGGLIAQRLAELGRARAIVLLASAPPSRLTAQAVALPHFAPQLPRILAGKPFVVGPRACSVLALNRMPQDQRGAIHERLTPESGKVYRDMMLGAVRINAARVTVPVLVMGGSEDRIVSPALVRSTAHHFGVEPRLYEGRGHWIIQEPGWEELVDEVHEWLVSAA